MTEFLRLNLGPMSFISAPGKLRESKGALYLGNIPNALKLGDGLHKRFWAILNCTDDPGLDKLNSEPGFQVKRLNHLDGEPYPPSKVKEAIEFIDSHMEAASAVLVCCHAGMSRSPGIVLAYLLSKDYSYNEAIKIIRTARPFIQVHPAVDKSIRTYFKLAPRTAADLIGG